MFPRDAAGGIVRGRLRANQDVRGCSLGAPDSFGEELPPRFQPIVAGIASDSVLYPPLGDEIGTEANLFVGDRRLGWSRFVPDFRRARFTASRFLRDWSSPALELRFYAWRRLRSFR